MPLRFDATRSAYACADNRRTASPYRKGDRLVNARRALPIRTGDLRPAAPSTATARTAENGCAQLPPRSLTAASRRAAPEQGMRNFLACNALKRRKMWKYSRRRRKGCEQPADRDRRRRARGCDQLKSSINEGFWCGQRELRTSTPVKELAPQASASTSSAMAAHSRKTTPAKARRLTNRPGDDKRVRRGRAHGDRAQEDAPKATKSGPPPVMLGLERGIQATPSGVIRRTSAKDAPDNPRIKSGASQDEAESVIFTFMRCIK